jgi:adenylate cyclase class IV
MSKFEIELRGLLVKDQKEKLGKFLTKNGKLVKQYKRTQWIFGLSHEKKVDVRIKETNGEYEFSLKVGKIGNANRKEISIPFPPDKFKQSLEFLKYLDRREGVKAIRNAKIFIYKSIEWAIVEVPGHSNYFEAEKLVNSKKEGKAAEDEIRSIASELGLSIFTPRETVNYIKKLDKEANKVFHL